MNRSLNTSLLPILRSLCIALVLTASVVPQVFASEGGTDAREQCRIQISGAFLGFMNDLDLMKGTLASTSEANFAMKAQRKLAARELQALNAHNEAQKTPAAELDEKVLGLQNALDSKDEEILDADVRITTIKDQIAAKEKAFLTFKDKIKLVFETTSAKVINTGGYPLRLKYRHPCSQYQALCPLPKPQSIALLKLSKDLEDPLACEHYANMSTADQ